MNTTIALLGLVEILSAISAGILMLFITYRMLRVFGLRKHEIGPENTAYNIIIASILFAVGYFISNAIQPIIDLYRVLSSNEAIEGSLIFEFLALGGLFIGIATVASWLVSILGITLYGNMTPLKEIEEIKSNNLGVAVIISTIVITLSLMTAGGVELLLESLVPYPDLPPR